MNVQVDPEHVHLLNVKWTLHDGYLSRYEYVNGRRRRVYLHRKIMGLEHGDKRTVDHKDGNKVDCRRSNLRIATLQEQAQNVPARGGSSQHRGVSLDKRTGKWRASYSKVKLGSFDTEDEAASVAAAYRREHVAFAVEGR